MTTIGLFFLLLAGNGGDCQNQDENHFKAGVVLAQVSARPIDEASGLVAGRANPDLLWTHNDSGDGARVFALDLTGRHLATVQIEGAKAEDAEDIAAGPGPIAGVHYLFLADTGNNDAHRGKPRPNVTVFRFPEPKIAPQAEAVRLILPADRITLTYEDGAHDVETFLVDPLNGDFYACTKRDGRSRIYRAEAPGPGDAEIKFIFTGEMRLLSNVAGDISPNGRLILIKDYGTVYLFRRAAEQSVTQALSSPDFQRIDVYQFEPQGEAIAFDHQGRGFFALSESRGRDRVPLYYYGPAPD